jgi:hypothetical protein
MRRTRATAWSRALHRETTLTPADLIWPLFVTDGEGVDEPIAALPGVSRWSPDGIAARAKEAVSLGIPCVALFPNTPAERRSEDGAEALNPDNLMCRAIRAIRDACGSDVGVLTDVALDPYTSHGQDGLVDGAGYVLNDATAARLTPARWAKRAVDLYHRLEADRIVAEVNQGGEMVEAVIRQADEDVPVGKVRAYRGKYLRAEPIAALYEQGRVKHVGALPELEDEMCDFGLGGLSSGRSPDRLDAMVWALSALMLTKGGKPRIRGMEGNRQ